MKLFVGPLSLFSAKSRIALAEKGVEPELVFVGWSREARYEPHHPAVVALNPKRQVPVLVDGDVVVCDSTLIFEYLEERLPEPPLYPRDLASRTRCRQLEQEGDEVWFPYVWDLIEARFYASDGREASRASTATLGLESRFQALEQQLVDRDFLLGDFSAADISIFIQAHTAEVLGAPIPAHCTAVQAWKQRIGMRATVAPVLADMMKAAAEALSPRDTAAVASAAS